MKVLLLNPPFKIKYGRYSRSSRSPAITKGGTLYYPIWLAYATGVLEKEGYQVKLIDSCAYGYNQKKTYEIAKEFQPKLIVLDTSTPSIYNDVEVAAKLKEILPESFTVLVGTHPTALPQETLNLNSKIDAIARGEYDYTLLDLANNLKDSKDIKTVKGLTYRKGEQIFSNQGREFIQNLDDLPFVSQVYKKHLDVKRYFFSAAPYPMVMIITGRGCFGRCLFCVYPQVMFSHQVRFRSPESIIAEWEYILKELPEVKTVGIEDDTFTIDKIRVQEVCRLLIKKGFNRRINWWVNTRVDTLDFETMKLMREAGCCLLIPGFESGSQAILDRINKGIRVEEAKDFVKDARKAKLRVHGCFILGNPGETKETMNQTLNLALELNLDSAQFFPLIVYPGTKAFEWTEENNFLLTRDYKKWLTPQGLHNSVIKTEALEAEDLLRFCNYARRRFYLRPKYIGYKLWQSLKSQQERRRNIKAAKLLLPHLVKERS